MGTIMVRLIILRLLESYFRHRWLYLLPVVMMVGVGVVSSMSKEPKYIAQGILYVQKESYLASLTSVRDDSLSWWLTPAGATADEMNDLIQTNAFVRAVISTTKLEDNMDEGPDAIQEAMDVVRSSVWISTLGDNQVLVGAAHTDPLVTYQLINSVIDNYTRWKINADLVESQAAQAFLSDLIQKYQTDLDAAHQALRDYLITHPAPIRGDRPDLEMIEVQRLQGDIQVAANRYTDALEKEENAQLATSQVESDVRQTYFLMDAPRMPDEAATSLKDTVMDIAIFVAVGGVLSVVGIAGSALIDRSLRFPVDVRYAVSLPVLATVPDVKTAAPWFLRKQEPSKSVKAVSVTPVYTNGHHLEPEISEPTVASLNGVNGSHSVEEKI